MSDDARGLVGALAGAVALLALVPYVMSIYRGYTTPNRASWFIWTVVGFMTAASYHASGATHTFWVPVAYVINPFTVALLSIRYGTPGASRLDWSCLALSLISALVWWFQRSAPIALYLNIAADALGALPTVRKAYVAPASEDRLAWLIAFLANAINLLAVDRWTPEIALYPLYAFVVTGAIAAILLLRRPATPARRIAPNAS